MSEPGKIIPPLPGDGFTWVPSHSGWVLVCDALGTIGRHIFTTRHWRLGKTSTADAWREVAEAVGADPARLCRARQVHGAGVIVSRTLAPPDSNTPADILVGSMPAMALAVQTADCVPLLLGDARTGAVAAAHAGWRGTALGVAGEAVRAMETELGSRPEDLIAAVGPSIGPCCYEVGEDVRHQFSREGFTDDQLTQWFATEASDLSANPPMPPTAAHASANRLYLDLWHATRDQLEDAGVRPDQIFVSSLCTASHPETFCSYRRDGQDAGRLAAAIKRRDPV